jgi:chemotaxis methyl-accepting protein methylase
MWEQAFQRALREVHVEVLKERIRKAWGRQIEAVADEVVKAMTEEWTAFMRREAARDALRETVRRGFAKGPQ